MIATLLFDGACVFCTRSVRTLERLAARGTFTARTIEDVGVRMLHPGLANADLNARIHLVRGRELHVGVDAIAHALGLTVLGAFLRMALRVSFIHRLATFAYDQIARRRYRLAGHCSDACALPAHAESAGERLRPL